MVSGCRNFADKRNTEIAFRALLRCQQRIDKGHCITADGGIIFAHIQFPFLSCLHIRAAPAPFPVLESWAFS